MRELGHADPDVTLRIYAHVMAHEDGERERLRGLVEGASWALVGNNDAATDDELSGSVAPAREDSPPLRDVLGARPAGFEPAASRSGGERSIH
jgi:hypothetical protein